MSDKDKPKKYVINVGLGNDNEPESIFVGANGQDFLIKRGVDVTVPKEVLQVLDTAIVGVAEVDPSDPNKTRIVDRKRFPYSIVGIV